MSLFLWQSSRLSQEKIHKPNSEGSDNVLEDDADSIHENLECAQASLLYQRSI